jgi:hypothetical protein
LFRRLINFLCPSSRHYFSLILFSVFSHNCETDRAEFFFRSLSNSSSEEILLTRARGRLHREHETTKANHLLWSPRHPLLVPLLESSRLATLSAGGRALRYLAEACTALRIQGNIPLQAATPPPLHARLCGGDRFRCSSQNLSWTLMRFPAGKTFAPLRQVT